MTDNHDTEWLDTVSKHYSWPDHSRELEHRILNQAKPRQVAKRDYMAECRDFFSFNWQPAFALTAALVLGIYTGSLTLPQGVNVSQVSPYMSSSYIMAQSIVMQDTKGAAHD